MIKYLFGIQVIVNNVGEYLNYSDCKCRKKLTDKLIDECIGTIEETKLVNTTFTENENNYECTSCIVYIALMIIASTIFTVITVYLVYYNWYLINNNDDDDDDDDDDKNKNLMNVIIKMDTTKQINIKNRTYYFYNDIIDIENFDAKLLKIDKKLYKDIDIFNIGYVTKKKIGDCMNINSANLLYLSITLVNGYIEQKDSNKYLVFDSTDENKELL